jgi:hypothetical protein
MIKKNLLSLIGFGATANDRKRSRLLARYPNHLDLIDSRKIPCEYSSGPDLLYFTESAQFYYDLIVDSVPDLKDRPHVATDADREKARVAYNRIVNATWGLIARGMDAIPCAVRLVRSSDRDQREAAANVFCGLRDATRLPEIIAQITAVLEKEDDQLVIDSLLAALGNLRSREAIPILSRFVVDENQDSDTRFTAAISLGQILKRKFSKDGADAIGNACAWLAENGFGRI